MGREPNEIKDDIAKVKYDISFIKEKLDDFKRRHDLFREKIWIEYRRDSDEISRKKSDAAEAMNYYEREIDSRKDRIRDLEGNSSNYERDSDDARRDVDRMRHDDVSDSDQLYDFMQKERDAENADRRRSQNQDEIDRLKTEIDDFMRRFEAKRGESGNLDDNRVSRRQERKDKLFQCKVYFEDLASGPLSELRGLKNDLDNLVDELQNMANDNTQTSSEKSSSSKNEAYSEYLGGHLFNEDDGGNEDALEDVEPCTVYVRDPNLFNEEKNERRDVDLTQRQQVHISANYKDRHEILKSYADETGRQYKVYPTQSGFSASVGRTFYRYSGEQNLTIQRKLSDKPGEEAAYPDTVPSVADFVVILEAEKKAGRNFVNMGRISSAEYKARLLIACYQVGLKPRGDIKLNPEKIEDRTLNDYENLPSARDNLRKIEELKSRRNKNNGRNPVVKDNQSEAKEEKPISTEKPEFDLQQAAQQLQNQH